MPWLPCWLLLRRYLWLALPRLYRGYYEGLGNMVPTAFSQVLEAAIKLGLGLAAAGAVTALCQREYASQGTVLGLTPSGEDQALFLSLSMGAAAAVLGVTAGSLVSPGVSGPALPFSRGRYRAAALSKFPSPSGAPGNPPPALGGHAAHRFRLLDRQRGPG